MRGTVAKMLRNEARKISTPTETKWEWFKRRVMLGDKVTTEYSGTMTTTGYRRTYQDMKKDYKKGGLQRRAE